MSDRTTAGLLAVVIGLAVAALAFVPIVAVAYRREGRLSAARLFGWVALCVYGMALWTYTLIPLPSDGYRCAGVQLDLIAAFADIGHYDLSTPRAILANPAVQQFLANIALFVPLGLLLRLLLHRGIVVATLTGLGVSLLIELTQLTGVWGVYPCAYRLFDVSDLLTNTVGAAIGSLLALAVGRRQRRRPADNRVTAWRRLLGMVVDLIALLLAGRVVAVAFLLVARTLWPEQSAETRNAIGTQLASWLPIAAVLVVVLVGGRTPGELAVLLRPTGGRRSRFLTNVLRFLGGIGGFGVLLGAGLAPLAGVLGLVSLIMVFTTRGHRGLAGLIAGTTIEIDPGPSKWGERDHGQRPEGRRRPEA